MILPALILAAHAAGVSCPGKDALIKEVRRKYAAAQKIAWRQEDAKEYLCAPFHVTAYYKDGLIAHMISERDDDTVYRREYYFEKGRLFFVFAKMFSRSEPKGPVTEKRVYLGKDCIVEKTRELNPRGVGLGLEDFDLSRVPETEEVLPPTGAGTFKSDAVKSELKLNKTCPADRQP